MGGGDLYAFASYDEDGDCLLTLSINKKILILYDDDDKEDYDFTAPILTKDGTKYKISAQVFKDGSVLYFEEISCEKI
ncbi:MAG: hypothetical protein LBD19_01460 [Endomicrobium sp.]|jgi:hypothetical protein|nr:hypothetical protein [Endomicrobium sp.]